MKIIIGHEEKGEIKIYDTEFSTIHGLTFLFSYNLNTKRVKGFNQISSFKKNVLKKHLNEIKNLANIGYNDYLTID
jgi:hypothetical protein